MKQLQLELLLRELLGYAKNVAHAEQMSDCLRAAHWRHVVRKLKLAVALAEEGGDGKSD